MSLTLKQAGAPAAPLAPSAPAAPPAQAPATRVGAILPGPNGTTQRLTLDDIAALRARKDELSRLLNSAHGRRREVQNELRAASTGPDRAGLEQRIGVLDGRIARLEQEIDENSGQLASLDAMRLTSGTRYAGTPGGNQGRNSDFPAEVVALFVLFPIALAFARNLWKRGSRPLVTPAGGAENTQRLERMEQAMEAIAIEIERVSEGQRFVTRLMAEGRPGLPAGEAAMEPLRIPNPSYVERR